MTKPLIIGGPAGVRRLAAGDLPIRIGSGASADIRVPGPVTGAVIGLISSLDDRPLLQATGADALAVNGDPVAATRWLVDGDVVTTGALRIECHFDAAALRFLVAYTDTEYATLPPVSATQGQPVVAISPLQQRVPGTAASGRRAWPWLVYGALALLAGVALYLFTARVVRVEVVPADAGVRLNGSWPAIPVGGSILVRPGAYTVRLSAAGYESRDEPITVGDEPRQTYRYELRKLPGRLRIEAQPAIAVDVTVDGQPAAAAADGSYRLAAGAHALRVTAARYLPVEIPIDIEGRDVAQRLPVQLQPNWADVTVTTEPAGAAIQVGEESLGTTPATVPVVAGAAQLRLQLDGYKTWQQALTVTAGEKLALPLVRLQEADGLLRVITQPAGAAVTVDGRYRGATPLELEIGSGRSHAVIVALPGFESVTRSISVARRASAVLRLDLVPRLGVVRVEAQPADAQLYVNGQHRGAAQQELTLPALPQRIEVRKEGFAPYAVEVTPRPGLPQAIQVQLLTPREAVLAATPKTVTTGQGLVLRRVEPGQFEMGAPRREQGRRPNESQRLVRLTRRFYMGTREVTNREFREFRPNHTSGAAKYQELAASEHPVVMLSWEEAVSFCNWLSDREGLTPAYALKDGGWRLVDPPTTGYRLPTEAEWEWASRYNGGGGARRYSWGDQMPPVPGAGNFADQSARGVVPNVLSSYDDRYPVTAPVGSFQPSPLGLYDLGGNVAEWVNDLYTVYPSGAAEAAVDPTGPATGQYHVVRGSSWRHASISELRLAYRDLGDQGRLDVGFRLARYADGAR